MENQRYSNKGVRFPPEPLANDEVQALIKTCSNRAPTGIRNKALIAIMWRGGLRVSEALSIYPKDLDPVNCSVRVLQGKGNKSRVAGLDPETFAFIDRWLDTRKKRGITNRPPLFCTLAGKQVDDSYVRHMLKRIAKRAGIEKRVHPHGLRHTHAFELLLEGNHIKTIQQQLGHSNPSTTATYCPYGSHRNNQKTKVVASCPACGTYARIVKNTKRVYMIVLSFWGRVSTDAKSGNCAITATCRFRCDILLLELLLHQI